MTILYGYLWFCLGAFVYCIGTGLYEDLYKGPDHKFGNNLLPRKIAKFDLETRTFVYRRTWYFNQFYWLFVACFCLPVINIVAFTFILYSTIRVKLEG